MDTWPGSVFFCLTVPILEGEADMKLMDLPVSERPREKAQRFGVEQLSTAELIAILLRSGSRQDSALALANRLLSQTHNGVNDLAYFTLNQLMELPGIGLAKATTLLASFELGRRQQMVVSEPAQRLSSPQAVVDLVKGRIAHLSREVFMVLQLNVKNDVISEEIVSQGTINSSIVHPREVFQNAIKNGAAAIIVTHNHPSGDPSPSDEDIQVTKRLQETGKIIGIPILDHVIIGKHDSFSMKAHGML